MSMSQKKSVDTTALCINHCVYYKPGKSEALQCQGFVAVRRIVSSGKELSLERPRHAAAPGAEIIEGLKGRVCSACEFRAADCDYILTNGTAPPCGGFALLSHLIGSGALTLNDIKEERK
jgi:hypothetical protein